MNYGELQSDLLALLNRRDCTPALANSFIQSSIKRIERDLRIPSMEKSIVATIGLVFQDGLAVPADLLQFIALTDEDTGIELTRTALPEILALQHHDKCGFPRHFARRGSKLLLGPLPARGKRLRMDYYATFIRLVAPSDSNVLSDVAPDLILRGALVYAATHFSDKRKADFETDFRTMFDGVAAQALRDELTGNAVVTPAFRFDGDWIS